ncbi:MAG: hypothetical protein HKM07_06955, partial [Chlamydiae bacterium]|nr:hypothetical protein [Chlamydiota bacterium]
SAVAASILNAQEDNAQEGQVESKSSGFRKFFAKLGLSSVSIVSDSSFPSTYEVMLAIQRMEFPPIFIQRKPEAKKLGNGEGRVDVDTYRAIIKDANLILSRLQFVTWNSTKEFQKEADTIIKQLIQRLDTILLQAKSHQKVYERVDGLAEQWFGNLALHAKQKDREKARLTKEVVKSWLYVQEKKIASLAYDLLAAHLKQEDASNDTLTQVNTLAVDLEPQWEEIQSLIGLLDELVIALAGEQQDLSKDGPWRMRWQFTLAAVKDVARKVKDLEQGKVSSPHLEIRESMFRDSMYSTFSMSSLGSTFSTVPRGMFPSDGRVFFLDLVNNHFWIQEATKVPTLSFSDDSALVRINTLENMVAFKARINREIDEFCKEGNPEWFSIAKDLGVDLSQTIHPHQKAFARDKLRPGLETAFFDAINSAFAGQMNALVEETKKDLMQLVKTKEGAWKGEETDLSEFLEFVCTERKISLFSFTTCRSDDELRSAMDTRKVFEEYFAMVFYTLRGRPICDKALLDKLVNVSESIRVGEASQRPRRKTGGREMLATLPHQEQTE